jgi:predicted methyltransferase
MTVVELWPGAGWYTAILAPLLADRGELVVTNLDPNGPPGADSTRFAKKYAERLASKPALFGKVKVRTLRPGGIFALEEHRAREGRCGSGLRTAPSTKRSARATA